MQRENIYYNDKMNITSNYHSNRRARAGYKN